MTNLEKLQKASLKELVELLVDITEYVDDFGHTHYASPNGYYLSREEAEEEIIKWLKEDAR